MTPRCLSILSSAQQMLLFRAASNFGGLFAGFPAEAFFFQLFHETGGSGVADAEAALAPTGASRSFV
ncbi:MAG: hypothetical protein MUO97_10880 [Dehalococcoidia bacterium]|nr:hypothetical protein [Dehalococcoidia bacterium]